GTGPLLGQVVAADDHVLGGRRDGSAGSGQQYVVRRQHQDARFGLCLRRQGDVYRHLVAVEVGIVSYADQRMNLNGTPFNEDRLERLDTEAVKGGRAVQQHRVLLDDVLEHIPDLGAHAFDHALRALDVVRVAFVDQALHDEWLEELQRHLLRQAALVHLQVRADHDDRAT